MSRRQLRCHSVQTTRVLLSILHCCVAVSIGTHRSVGVGRSQARSDALFAAKPVNAAEYGYVGAYVECRVWKMGARVEVLVDVNLCSVSLQYHRLCTRHLSHCLRETRPITIVAVLDEHLWRTRVLAPAELAIATFQADVGREAGARVTNSNSAINANLVACSCVFLILCSPITIVLVPVLASTLTVQYLPQCHFDLVVVTAEWKDSSCSSLTVKPIATATATSTSSTAAGVPTQRSVCIAANNTIDAKSICALKTSYSALCVRTKDAVRRKI